MNEASSAELGGNHSISILVADDDQEICSLFSNVLGELGFDITTVLDGRSALELMKKTVFDIALFDIRMPHVDGLALLDEAKRLGSPSQVIIVTGYGTLNLADKAMKLGAYDFITKPFAVDDVQKVVSRIVQTGLHVTRAELPRRAGQERCIFHDIVSRDTKMHQVFEVISKVARSKCTVLIQGESGTGKELVARAIHASSVEADNAFIPIDCCSINENLIESELFGHEKGAFTGAHIEKEGLFRVASGGTIFLDEISEIPVEVQARLLRALQERKVRPIGGTRYYDIDVRVIAATHKNLQTAIKDGAFREDLFFRLSVVPIEVPPLRERKGDIPLLINHFVQKFQREDNPVKGVSQDAMKVLLHYDWPGNVRELENVVHGAIALSGSDTIRKDDLPSSWLERVNKKEEAGHEFRPKTLAELERVAIERTLEETGGDKAAAARVLGINKSTLYRKLQKYSLS